MLKIYNIKEKQEFLREVAELTQKEWGSKTNSKKMFEEKINNKISKIINNFDNPLYCKLILLDNDILIGFISIFPTDGEERKDLSPWYSTMYVKREFRGKGYSKILNDAILEEYFDEIVSSFKTSIADKNNIIYANERVKYWFDEAQIDDLLKLRSAIYRNVKNEYYLRFFLCAFSNILKSCSRWLTKSIKPQIDPDKCPKNVIAAFSAQVKMMRIANSENKMGGLGNADIHCLNFLEANIENPFVDLVITSPPYVTSYEYADLHQLSTLWLEYAEDFRTLRKGSIGSLYHAMNFTENVERLNNTAGNIVSQMNLIDKRKARSIAQYYIDMQCTIKKVHTMLNVGGACFFVIGNTEYKGIKIDNAKHLTECLLTEGFSEIEVDRRKISNKILTPYRDVNGKFASIKGCSRKVYSEEFVIFAKKI